MADHCIEMIYLKATAKSTYRRQVAWSDESRFPLHYVDGQVCDVIFLGKRWHQDALWDKGKSVKALGNFLLGNLGFWHSWFEEHDKDFMMLRSQSKEGGFNLMADRCREMI